MSSESSADDEFSSLLKMESNSLIENLVNLQDRMLECSFNLDRDINECIIEIKAGVGGQEASLFAKELHLLYIKFINFNGWKIRFNEEGFDPIETIGNASLFHEIIQVEGFNCYNLLKHEAGTHRVQRVPKTEKYGRIHTSTVSIAVIPIRDSSIKIKESDLKFEVKNSSGPGGQNVNRNLTCVRVTHLPTGHSIQSQESRFQYINKEIAIKKLETLLNRLEYERWEKEVHQQKFSQIGIAARSDKIRTYNFPQDRITDHRISGNENTIHNIEGYMNGEECDKMKQIIIKLQDIKQNDIKTQLRLLLEKNFEQINLTKNK